jgi:hypothetical protein
VAKGNVPRLKLYIEDEDRTSEELAAIGARARDAKPVMRLIQALMMESSAEQFLSEGASVGEPWKRDTDEWTERKQKEGLSDGTLERRGDLRSAMLAKTSGGASIRRLSKQSTSVGVRIYYARFAGKKRRLLTMTVPQQDKYASMMIDYILTGRLAKL